MSQLLPGASISRREVAKTGASHCGTEPCSTSASASRRPAVKTFIVLLGSGRRQAVGRYPVLSLGQAREKAKRILAERLLGRHQTVSLGWRAAVQKFIDARRSTTPPATVAEYDRTLKRYFAFGTTRLSEITKQDISGKLENLNRTPSQQAHSLVICKMFFRWALVQGLASKTLPETRSNTPTLLFPARGTDRPFNGWSKSKAALDQLSGVKNWTLHDLRRTFRTIHGRIGNTTPHRRAAYQSRERRRFGCGANLRPPYLIVPKCGTGRVRKSSVHVRPETSVTLVRITPFCPHWAAGLGCQ